MRILLIDDDEVFCQALKINLSKHRYVVDTAPDGQEGWDVAEAGEYDLIVLDVVMPKLDGISFCRQLRSKGCQVLVMLLTARGTSHDKIIGLDAGADDYVVKPIPLEELEARIRALLRRKATNDSPVLKWGNLRLDSNAKKFTYEDIILNLTAKEYALLELFIRNTEKIHSQSNIINQIWSFEEEAPTGDTVRTLVKRLRQKLKLVGALDLIETVYGLGYRLNHKFSKVKKIEKTNIKSKQEKSLSNNSLNVTEINSSLHKKSVSILKNKNSLDNTKIWEELKLITLEEISKLEEAISSLKPGIPQQDSWENAKQITHKLIGSLSIFGSNEATQLIKYLDYFFHNFTFIKPDRHEFFTNQVKNLRSFLADSDISKSIKQADNNIFHITEAELENNYRLLIVDEDREFIDNLVLQAANRNIQTVIAANIQSAKDAIARLRPDIVLLDMSSDQNIKDGLDLLEHLSIQQPPIPTLVVSNGETPMNRVAIARRQIKGFWRKPVTPDKVLDALTQIILPTKKVEAKVLLLDDDRINLRLLKTLLEPWGLQVTTLNNSLKFWEELEIVMPDILVLDVQMPNIDGIELCQMIRNDQRWSWIPILFLTSQDDCETVQKAFAAGADDFVSKPIIAAQVTTRILNRLERNRLLREQAEIDILTSLPNRHRASQDLAKLLHLAKQYQQPLCFTVLSLNNLIKINHKYGNRLGDQILYKLAYLLKQELRSEDIISRWNGAEFIIGMYGINRSDGVEWLAEILEIMRQVEWKTTSNETISTSFSAGVAQYPEDGSQIQDLYQAATSILTKAKDSQSNPVNGQILPTTWKSLPSFSVEDKSIQSKVDVILLYEKSDFANSIVSALITRGYHSYCLQDGDSALSFLAGKSPSLYGRIILLQDNLPGKDGLQILENFKKNTIIKTSKILWLSNEFKNVELAMKMGCFDYVNLPCKISAIMYQLRHAWDKY